MILKRRSRQRIARHFRDAEALPDGPEEARNHYQEALKIATGMRSRPDVAVVRLQRAEWLQKHNPERSEELRREASENLDYAIREFKDMNMQPFLNRASKDKEILGA